MFKWIRRHRSSPLEDVPEIERKVVWRRIEEGKLIVAALNMESGFVHMFEDASARIWQLCNGERTIGQIARAIREEFPDTRQEDIIEFISKLRENGLIRSGNRKKGINLRSIDRSYSKSGSGRSVQ